MESCYKCGRAADFICPDCGTKACKSHMELRYTGPDRGFKSRFMCPSCWKSKRVKLNQDMVRADAYRPKTYVAFGRRE
ncbi:MAG TPA: hypothetical protein VEM40_12990 [Nitrospirota bacterium]|nr:hypothetical protein [Nitrospirota bacterium]